MINKISIIIPVYNEILYFERSLQEIVQLRLINNIKKEIIIIDDFSTDETVEKIKNFEKIKDLEIKHKDELIKLLQNKEKEKVKENNNIQLIVTEKPQDQHHINKEFK